MRGNNVLLVKIEELVWYTIYHHRNLLLKGFLQTPLCSSTNNGKRTSMLRSLLTKNNIY